MNICWTKQLFVLLVCVVCDPFSFCFRHGAGDLNVVIYEEAQASSGFLSSGVLFHVNDILLSLDAAYTVKHPVEWFYFTMDEKVPTDEALCAAMSAPPPYRIVKEQKEGRDIWRRQLTHPTTPRENLRTSFVTALRCWGSSQMNRDYDFFVKILIVTDVETLEKCKSMEEKNEMSKYKTFVIVKRLLLPYGWFGYHQKKRLRGAVVVSWASQRRLSISPQYSTTAIPIFDLSPEGSPFSFTSNLFSSSDNEIVSDKEDILSSDYEIVSDKEDILSSDYEIVSDKEDILSSDYEIVSNKDALFLDDEMLLDKNIFAFPSSDNKIFSEKDIVSVSDVATSTQMIVSSTSSSSIPAEEDQSKAFVPILAGCVGGVAVTAGISIWLWRWRKPAALELGLTLEDGGDIGLYDHPEGGQGEYIEEFFN